MNKTLFARLTALLLAALLLALPAALSEEVVCEPVEAAVPAADAGDAGLWAEEDEPAPAELEEFDLPVGPEEGGGEAPEEGTAPAVDAAEGEAAALTEQGLAVAARTQDEIQAFVDAHPAYSGQINIYTVAPTEAPYAPGKLSPVNQQSALNLLNQMRYIAGLNADLALMTEREDMEAAAAMVLKLYNDEYMALNNKQVLTHYPPRPAVLADSRYDALYSLGYGGTSRSNIAVGLTVTGAILEYMHEPDSADIKNSDTLGHRRWILNPRMGRTIAGADGRFTAMYAQDQSDASAGQTRVAWPAQQMPVQYFAKDDPWSVSFGETLDASQVEVALTRRWDGKTWRFAQDAADGLFAVNNGAYGQRGCVIFRPDGLDSIAINDAFDVSITTGDTVTRYTVQFFSLDMSASAALSRTTVTAVKTDVGNLVSWTAVERAVGYYVCRREPDGLYAVVADVSGALSYLDGDAGDETAYYQVYPHTNCVTCPLASGVKAEPPQPESIALNRTGTVKLYVGETLQLELALEPAYARTGLFWSSTYEPVATVTQDGLVTAVKKGVANIVVVTDNDLRKRIKVQVLKPTSLKGAKVSVSDKTYTGEALKPAVKVKLGKVTLAKDTDYKLAYSNNTKVGVATVRITGVGAYTGTVKATFRVKPVKVKGLSVKAGSGRLAVSWKKAGGVTGYQVQYAAKKDFSDARTTTVKKANVVRTTLKDLKKGTTYYVRVRSYKSTSAGKVCSDWSAAVKKRAK